MNKFLLSLFAIVFLSANCFAENVELAGKMDAEHGGKGFHGGPGWCHLELSEEQHAKMRSEKFKYEESRIDLEAQLKHSRLAYRELLSDPNSDYSAAKNAAKEIANVVQKMASSKALFKADIAYKVFTTEQRKEMVKCGAGGRVNGPGHPFFGHPGERMGMDETNSMDEAVAMLDDSSEE